jgi:hypothetical protein
MTWWLQLARSGPWRAVLARWTRLHGVYLARTHLGIPAPLDGRVRERGGLHRDTLWHVTRFAPVEGRTRWVVRFAPLARPGRVEARWVNDGQDALAWVVLAVLVPAWALVHLDGDDPWTLLRGLEEHELVETLEDIGEGDADIARMVDRHRSRTAGGSA